MDTGLGAQERRWAIAEWRGRGLGRSGAEGRWRGHGVKKEDEVSGCFFSTHYVNDCACLLCLSTLALVVGQPSTTDYFIMIPIDCH